MHRNFPRAKSSRNVRFLIFTNHKTELSKALESEDSLHQEVVSAVTQLNADISPDDPETEYISTFNGMFQFFDKIYHKNLDLLEVCNEKNGSVVVLAKKISDILKSSNEGKEQITMLAVEYQKAINAAKEARDKEIASKEIIYKLKGEINEISKKVPPEPPNQEEIINELRKEISSIEQIIVDQRLEMIDIKNQLKDENDSLTVVQSDIMALQNEEDRINNALDEFDKVENQTKKDNAETEAIIAEERKVLEQLTEDANEKLKTCEEFRKHHDGIVRAHEDLSLSIVEETKSNEVIYHQTKKYEKELKELKKMNKMLTNQYIDIDAEYKKRVSQYNHFAAQIKVTDEEIASYIPQYNEIMQKYEGIIQEKSILKKRENIIRTKVLDNAFTFTKSENQRQQDHRQVTTAKIELTLGNKKMNDEESKTDEIIGQTQTVSFETLTIKKHLHEMKQAIIKLYDEIDEKRQERERASTNIILMQEIVKNTISAGEKAVVELNNMMEKNEHQAALTEKLRNERNIYKRQFEQAKHEHEELKAQYEELVSSIEQMTGKIEELLKAAMVTHYASTENKLAIESLQQMKEQCSNGIIRTRDVIVKLQSEMQSMKRILETTEHAVQDQRIEYKVVEESKAMLLTQLAAKKRIQNSQHNNIITDTVYMKKRSNDFLNKSLEIINYQQELAKHRKKTQELEVKVEYLLDLQFQWRRYTENVAVEKSKSMALYYEGDVRRNIHKWHELQAVDPERVTSLKYLMLLSGKYDAAHRLLIELRHERDKLKEKAKALKTKADEALPIESVLQYMQKYREDLQYKDQLALSMQQMIDDKRGNCFTTRSFNEKVRMSLSQRKESYVNLRASNREERRALSPPAQYITEPPAVYGGGFKPHPPSSARTDVPRLNLKQFDTAPAPRPPGSNSQRYLRDRTMSARKKKQVTRPVHTARKNSQRSKLVYVENDS